MPPKKLLEKLARESYCRLDTVVGLDPDQLRGLRVMAIRDIPVGKLPFRGRRMQVKDIPANLINELPVRLSATICDACVPDAWGGYAVPEHGLDDLNLAFFVRHGARGTQHSVANLELVESTPGDTTYEDYATIRDIKAGEELVEPGVKKEDGNFTNTHCDQDLAESRIEGAEDKRKKPNLHSWVRKNNVFSILS